VSTPILEHIALNIEAAVNAVTEANGFNQDLSAMRPKRNDFYAEAAVDKKVVVVAGGAELTDSHWLGASQWVQEFILVAFVIDSDEATASIDIRINQVVADLRKKLAATPNRGGYALDTNPGDYIKFSDGEGVTGVAVAFDVLYRTKEDDPYTQN